MENQLSIIAIAISCIGILISGISVYYCRRQTKYMEKPKFTDEPHNAYTAKLDAIKNAIDRVAQKLDK